MGPEHQTLRKRGMKENMKSKNILKFITISILAGLTGLKANVSVPEIFSEHAVLQRGDKTPVWGWADPGESVKVSLGDLKGETKAGTDGKWKVELSLKEANSKPQDLVIEGKNRITIPDVLVGEVWLCAGQSNMEFKLSRCDSVTEEIAQSANPLLREFTVSLIASPTPLEKSSGKWSVAGPETSGGFTAVGYYFGKKIQKDLQVPVALIHSSWGGTPVEAWTSNEGFKNDPVWNDGKEKQITKVKAFDGIKKQFLSDFETWVTKTNRVDKRIEDPSPYSTAEIPATGWTKVQIPGEIAGEGLPPQGAFWVRREVEIPDNLGGKELKFIIEEIAGFEEVFWNGQKVWEMKVDQYPGIQSRRDIKVNAESVKAGKNIIAIRLYAPLEKPKIADLRILLATGPKRLSGEWMAKAEYALPAVNPLEAGTPQMYNSIPLPQNTCSYLYNGMIAPWIPYGIRGVNWYQGEANIGSASQYQSGLSSMIKDWRGRWGEGDFFFNLCQLANYGVKTDQPGESGWAELRDSQTQVSLTLPHVGIANLIDQGEANDIHPRIKKYVGERLALNAEAEVYGKSVAHTGPLYDSMKIEGDKIRIQFKNTEGGLVAKPLPETYFLKSLTNETAPYVKFSPESELQGFMICGEEKIWKWANAKIEKDTVVVSSPDIKRPVAVRYAWANNPTCNLYNGAGLPALSFRTDRFPRITEGKNL